MATVALISTGMVVVEPIKRLILEILADTKVMNIVDESVAVELKEHGGITVPVIRRICRYAIGVEEAGAEAVLVTCSSISPVVDKVQPLLRIPIVKIDEAMAEKAVEIGTRIGVVATVFTTLDPTVSLIKDKAQSKGKKIEIRTALCEDALKFLLSGDTALHDRLLSQEIQNMSQKMVDVIVLAQASMERIVPIMKNQIGIPLLTSPRLGVTRLKEILLKRQSNTV